MTELEKLFDDIQNQLNQEKLKHRRLKICKYSFEISKVAILSVATGLSYFNICYSIYDINPHYRFY